MRFSTPIKSITAIIPAAEKDIPTGVPGVAYCHVCDGQGVMFCNHQKGRLEVYVDQQINDDQDWQDCPHCHGDGKIYSRL